MNKSVTFGFALAAAIFAGGMTAPTARAAGFSRPRPLLREAAMERARQRLELTDEQAARIKAVVREEKDAMLALLSRLREARAGLRGAIQAPGATEASVRAASAEVAAVEADLAVERLKLYGKLSPILTEEQRGKLSAFRARVDELLEKALGRAAERGND